MKDLKQVSAILSTVFCVITMATSSNLFAQENSTELADFLIVVETSDNDFKLTCKEGCAWKELTFNSSMKKTQAIDQHGMSKLARKEPKKDSKLSNFLFTLEKTKNGLSLKGIEGTAWTDLSFSCPDSRCGQAIDQKGMTKLN